MSQRKVPIDSASLFVPRQGLAIACLYCHGRLVYATNVDVTDPSPTWHTVRLAMHRGQWNFDPVYWPEQISLAVERATLIATVVYDNGDISIVRLGQNPKQYDITTPESGLT